MNDISIRDFQYHTTQFMPGKAWEGSTPVGPLLVVAEPGDEAHFPIECIVDDRVMQSSNTRELCFGPIALIQYISTFITLVPGDLIVTGTPSGVGHARDPEGVHPARPDRRDPHRGRRRAPQPLRVTVDAWHQRSGTNRHMSGQRNRQKG